MTPPDDRERFRNWSIDREVTEYGQFTMDQDCKESTNRMLDAMDENDEGQKNVDN